MWLVGRAVRLASYVYEMPIEWPAFGVGIEDAFCRPKQFADAIQVVENLELGDWVVPRAGVVSADERGQGCERLDLDVVLPPARPEDQTIAVTQPDRVGRELVPPDPARVRR